MTCRSSMRFSGFGRRRRRGGGEEGEGRLSWFEVVLSWFLFGPRVMWSVTSPVVFVPIVLAAAVLVPSGPGRDPPEDCFWEEGEGAEFAVEGREESIPSDV